MRHSLYPNLKIFFGAALVLNIIWEFAHAPLYAGNFAGYHHLVAAVLDATILMALLYCARKFKYAPNKFIVLSGLAVAIAVEFFALQTGLWNYGSTMPIIPILGIGLTPTVQLAITGLISLKIAK